MKKTTRNQKFALITMVLIFFFMLGMWTIDVSVSASISGLQTGSKFVMTNGFWELNPILTYHVGIYIVILTFIIQMMLLIDRKII